MRCLSDSFNKVIETMNQRNLWLFTLPSLTGCFNERLKSAFRFGSFFSFHPNNFIFRAHLQTPRKRDLGLFKPSRDHGLFQLEYEHSLSMISVSVLGDDDTETRVKGGTFTRPVPSRYESTRTGLRGVPPTSASSRFARLWHIVATAVRNSFRR